MVRPPLPELPPLELAPPVAEPPVPEPPVPEPLVPPVALPPVLVPPLGLPLEPELPPVPVPDEPPVVSSSLPPSSLLQANADTDMTTTKEIKRSQNLMLPGSMRGSIVRSSHNFVHVPDAGRESTRGGSGRSTPVIPRHAQIVR
jgi:hypothetical protein